MPPGTEDHEGVQEVKEYKIHISSKYLDLTRQKLEITRLPREESPVDSTDVDWWQPKATIEPLIDYWVEEYSWKKEEEKLNEQLPQFRISVEIPSLPSPIRIHLIHARSPHPNAIPLLLIPPFPFTNLSLGHLIQPLANPDNAEEKQPYHVIIPSLPGLGFSDALPLGAQVIESTAGLLDEAMKQLGYNHYIASNTGAAANSPARIEWKLAERLAHYYSESCLAVHLLEPPLQPPSFFSAPREWVKWKLFSWIRSPMLGYTEEDKTTAKLISKTQRADTAALKSSWAFIGDGQHAEEPSMLSYALCDSPTGTLLFVLMLLKVLGPSRQFSHAEILTMAELMWLPGPEGMLRFWASSSRGSERPATKSASHRKPMVGVTIFHSSADEVREEHDEEAALPRRVTPSYCCSAWAKTQFQVLSTNRVPGVPGLTAWEQPEIVEEGVRNLTKALLVVDRRLRPSEAGNIVSRERQVLVRREEHISSNVVAQAIEESGEGSSGLTSPRPQEKAGLSSLAGKGKEVQRDTQGSHTKTLS